MRILVAVLVVSVLGMGYGTYISWQCQQRHSVTAEELSGLRQENSRLVEENERLKTATTTLKGQLAAVHQRLCPATAQKVLIAQKVKGFK